MHQPPPQNQTVPTLQDLANEIGVNRRTLQEYRSQGCPCMKLGPKRWLVWPTLWWYTRRLMRDCVRRYVKRGSMPQNVEETLLQLLDDHEQCWTEHIEKQVSGGG